MKQFGKVFVIGMLFFSMRIEAHMTLLQKRVIGDLETIRNVFDVKYAPIHWKGHFSQWDLHQEIDRAEQTILSLHNPSLKECQRIMRNFFKSTQDYHVGITFFSTESASLPFRVKSAEGRYFICDIDREALHFTYFPFAVGDELLTFNDEPIDQVVQTLRLQEVGYNVLETDQAIAEMLLTQRLGCRGHNIPQGQVVLTGIQNKTKLPLSSVLEWDYVPEKIRDFSKLGLPLSPPILARTFAHTDSKYVNKKLKMDFFEKYMVAAEFANGSYVGSSTLLSKHDLGAKTSFIPILGKKIWKGSLDTPFHAYIFNISSKPMESLQNFQSTEEQAVAEEQALAIVKKNAHRIGYIRIPHYMGDEEEVQAFGTIMNFFEKKTDALIIDQVNNPGGSLFYMYALAAILADKPFHAPQHHISLTQEELNNVIEALEQLDMQDIYFTGEETIGGYPVNEKTLYYFQNHCNFLISQWEEGKLITDSTHFGIPYIEPHPMYHYSKPVLLLVNELDMSCADFFPAILQDNQRACILGTRTAGAGGYVLKSTMHNHSGIRSFQLTGSIVERENGEPIENLGVTPDVFYALTAEDLQDNYKGYVQKILQQIYLLIKKESSNCVIKGSWET